MFLYALAKKTAMDFNKLWFQEGSIENQITFANVDAFTF